MSKKHKELGIAIGDQFIDLETSLTDRMILLTKTSIRKWAKIFKMSLFGVKNYGVFIVVELDYQEEILNFSFI